MEEGAPFIVGTGRSGTTLLRMMLDAHSQLAIPPETDFGAALTAFQNGGMDPAVEAMTGSSRWADFDISAEDFVKHVETRQPAGFGDLLRCFYSLYAERRGKPRWGDKSPIYSGVMIEICRYLSEARFVHVIRDGRDVALSMVPLRFGPNTVEDVARLWLQTIESAQRQAQALPFYMEVRYEDLVCDPDETLQRVCDFLDLEWEHSMLDYHRHAPERLASELKDLRLPGGVMPRTERLAIHRRLGSPPQPERIGRWRMEMSRGDLDVFESIAGDALRTLGYETSASTAGRG